MSTKAIRELIDAVRRGEHPERFATAAAVETEAIERAARVVIKDKRDEELMPSELKSAYELMMRIVEEAS